MLSNATLDLPGDATSRVRHVKLLTAVRDTCTSHRYSRCVVVEIPLPAGITLRPGAAVVLRVHIAGSPITLRIPAVGHIHTATCNHKKAGAGAVWRAAGNGDAAALETALAAGGSTEEKAVDVSPVCSSLAVTGQLQCVYRKSAVLSTLVSWLLQFSVPHGGRSHPRGCGCRCECQRSGASYDPHI